MKGIELNFSYLTKDVYIYMKVYIYVDTYIHIRIQIYMHIYIYTRVYIPIHTIKTKFLYGNPVLTPLLPGHVVALPRPSGDCAEATGWRCGSLANHRLLCEPRGLSRVFSIGARQNLTLDDLEPQTVNNDGLLGSSLKLWAYFWASDRALRAPSAPPVGFF